MHSSPIPQGTSERLFFRLLFQLISTNLLSRLLTLHCTTRKRAEEECGQPKELSHEPILDRPTRSKHPLRGTPSQLVTPLYLDRVALLADVDTLRGADSLALARALMDMPAKQEFRLNALSPRSQCRAARVHP